MPPPNEIRAEFDAKSIVIYQAYSSEIALPAVAAQRFVSPFSRERMTWIKPSFLWLMERSNWGQKSGQEHILAVRITRTGWEESLSLATLTHPEPRIYSDPEAWRKQFDQSPVIVQWDPERSIRGTSREYYTIQVGLSRHIIDRYVDTWTLDIADYTPRVRKMRQLLKAGKADAARKLLPSERVYPISAAIAQRLNMPL